MALPSTPHRHLHSSYLFLRRSAAVATALLVTSFAAACGGEQAGAPAEGEAGPSENASTDTATTEASPGAQGDTVTCDYQPDGSPAEVDPPEATAPTSGVVEATLGFGSGDVTITMERAAAPCTTHSFESLAAQDFYTDTTCHRLADEGLFMLQCGDPTGTGMGGPGYQYADEVSEDTTYPAGTVAMANAGPDTNGSQFFLVFEDSPLPPAYTAFGTMDDDSVQVIRDIAAEGHDASNAPGDGTPHNDAVIETVTVTAQD